MQNTKELIQQEAARSAVYSRLADAFRQPGPDLPKVLDLLASAFDRLGSDACEAAVHLKRTYLRHAGPCALELDFTGLFVGPFLVPAPPYGSVYIEDNRQLMGDSTIDVRRHYLSLGLDLSPDFKEAPDHICAELEFMHVLIQQGLEAVRAEDYIRLSECIGHQGIFLQKHLAAWIPAFTARVIKHARTSYYRCLAEITQSFIAEEKKVVTDLTAVLAQPAGVR